MDKKERAPTSNHARSSAIMDNLPEMRIWSIHPCFLDSKGLVALWREGLLAQKVLSGGTKGYKNHPQLVRFRNTADPLLYIGNYLLCVLNEATVRGYKFDSSKIVRRTRDPSLTLAVTTGQMEFETEHLLKKLQERAPSKFLELEGKSLVPHPLFSVMEGPVAEWEKGVVQ